MSPADGYRGNCGSPIPETDRAAVEAAFSDLTGPEWSGQVQTLVDALGAAHAALGERTIAGYIEMGAWLHRLWDRTASGDWLRLFRDSVSPIDRPLPLSRQQAQAFMRLAFDPALSDPKNWAKLPGSWRIADEILRVAKSIGEPVQALIDSERVHRTLTRRKLLEAFAPVRKKKRQTSSPVTLDTIEHAVRLYVDRGGDLRALITLLRGRADVLEDQLHRPVSSAA